MSPHADPTFRSATRDDIDTIVRLLAEDPRVGAQERYEQPLPAAYLSAFEAIQADPNNELLVATLRGKVLAVLQLTYIPYIANQGGWRAVIDCVRIDAQLRTPAFGKALLDHAIARARARGCRVLQLTTDKARPQSKLFYEKLGFVPSHEGMKLPLET